MLIPADMTTMQYEEGTDIGKPIASDSGQLILLFFSKTADWLVLYHACCGGSALLNLSVKF